MGFADLFEEPAYVAEKRDLPILQTLINRYARTRPFEGAPIVFGHLFVWNSIALVEALVRGGAHLVLAEAHPSPATVPVRERLEYHGLPVLPVEQAVRDGEWFLDVAAVLGRARTPKGAAEVTRTGILHYARIPCPVISADDTRSKRIEGFFGTGDGFMRAWHLLRPEDPLAGKRLVIFGYGKIGRGVAHRTRSAGAKVTVIDIDPAARARAQADGFPAADGKASDDLRTRLEAAEVVIAVTGRPDILRREVSPSWLRRSRPVLVNLGAEDEFGPAFEDEEILGGRDVPLNFHLPRPTENRYVEAPLAAHLLALETLLANPSAFPPGIHRLPPGMDAWVVETWRRAWPHEDLTGIAADLGLAGP
jgi:adenosylhomocysteinase